MTQLVVEPYSTPGGEPAEVLGSARESRLQLLVDRVARPIAALRGVPRLLTWLGVVLCAVGFVLVAVAWGRSAGLTNVALQVPYVISAGFTGLGLVVVGVTLVSIDAKRADSAERTRQLRELRDVLADVHRRLEDRS